MTRFFLTILLFVPMIAHATDYTRIRTLFLLAPSSRSSAEELKSVCEKSTDNLAKAYLGASYAILASHYFNPYSKLQSLNTGLSYLNAAVTAASDDLEIRFLRFSVESKIPAMVPFTRHISADKEYLLTHQNAAHPMWTIIRGFLKSSAALSEADKKRIK